MSNPKATKTIADINERIRQGKAVVVTAEEMTGILAAEGPAKAAQQVDVVTTGTFAPMCSSGLFFNIGQSGPVIKASKIKLNNVPAYGGIAAVDGYIGVTEPTEDDPLNKVYPGRFHYGGGHVIEDLVAGRTVHLHAAGYGTDCYPRKVVDKDITLANLPFAQLVNPRNAYQNYNAAVNLGSKTIYTYMGPLKPQARNLNYSTAGFLSPLFNDPFLRTIGLGTRIWLGGGIGYVIGAGTQHVAKPKRNDRGIPLTPSHTLMVKGDLKGMKPRYLRGASFIGYGCSLSVGMGIPIPILDEDMAFRTGVDNKDIQMPVKDYARDYPNGDPKILTHATFEELLSGEIELDGKTVPTTPMSSMVMAREIAGELKDWIASGKFLLTEPVEKIPSE